MDLTRQKDLIDIEALESLRILVVGAGGIGSFLVNSLSKMGVQHIQVWDADKVEPHNLPNQNFRIDQLDHFKVEALKQNVFHFTGNLIDSKPEFWWGHDMSFNPDIIITGVDTMRARKDIWEGLTRAETTPLLLDARMGARTMYLAVVKVKSGHDSIVPYMNTLYSDEDAIQEPCTAKSIIHTPLATAYMVCHVIHEFINKRPIYQLYYGNLADFSLSSSATEVKYDKE